MVKLLYTKYVLKLFYLLEYLIILIIIGELFLIIIQIHNIIGSADFLGNPVGLFNNLSSGVVDIFYEPYQGFVMSDRPQDLGIGLARVIIILLLIKKTKKKKY
jgi:hypothetical protein